MKKTLKFDDGSVLVGSGSTFTVTQEDQGKIDIFDMPSKYIWLSSRDILDEADDYQGDTIYIGIYLRAGSKRYKLTVEDLQPFKYENIKCKVIERTETQDATAVTTLSDGTKNYIFDNDLHIKYSNDIVKIDCVQPIQRVNLEGLTKLTEVNLKGNINSIKILKNPKLTKITCDQAINPSIINLSNNPLLVQIPEFINDFQQPIQGAFAGDESLDIDISDFFLKGNCSNAFKSTGITNAQIKNAATNLSKLFYTLASPKLKTAVLVVSLGNCEDFGGMFQYQSNLTECDFSKCKFSKCKRMNNMFNGCSSLKSTKMNLSSLTNACTEIQFLYCDSAIADDIILPDTAFNLQYINLMCSSYTRRVKMPNSITKLVKNNNERAFANATSLEYLEWDNFGATPNITEFDFTANTKLGTGSEENLQAFKNLFINAFDRKTAGYAVCTVSLAAAQKALLTAEEITAFENKGYKIA